MINRLILLFIYCVLASTASTQHKQDYIWLLGNDATRDSIVTGFTIDFNQERSIESRITGGAIRGQNTSVCSTDGDLLFYTNGCYVLTADGQVMENGDSLNYDQWKDWFWDVDCTRGYPGAQDIYILKQPYSDSLYHILHKPRILVDLNGPDYVPIWQSKVDLAANDGRGKVLYKNQTLYDGPRTLISYLAAIQHSNGEDWWVLQPLANDSMYLTYLIDSTGIQRQPDQSVGKYLPINGSSAIGNAVFSPDGTQFVFYNIRDHILLYDFDRATGKLSNLRRIRISSLPDRDENVFGSAEWSPNGRFLYISSAIELHQVDLWAADIEADGIRLIDTWNGTQDPFPTSFYRMVQGPDCKIYMCSTNGAYSYHVINKPDELGQACDFVQNGIKLPSSSGAGAMPNFPRYRVDAEDKCDPTITSIFGEWVYYRHDLEVFPNPSTGPLHIRLPEQARTGYLSIYDLDGRLLEHRHIDQPSDRYTLSLGAHPIGTYVVEYYPADRSSRDFWSAKVLLAH